MQSAHTPFLVPDSRTTAVPITIKKKMCKLLRFHNRHMESLEFMMQSIELRNLKGSLKFMTQSIKLQNLKASYESPGRSNLLLFILTTFFLLQVFSCGPNVALVYLGGKPERVDCLVNVLLTR